jgi:hypothetical protein
LYHLRSHWDLKMEFFFLCGELLTLHLLFYNSYCSWEKMNMDQQNKTLAYFLSLMEEMQSMCHC